MRIFLFIVWLYFSFLGIGAAYAQNMGIPTVPTPQYSNYGGNVPIPNVNGQVHLGATADEIMRQASSNIPYYKAPGDTRSTQQVNEAYIRQQMAKDPAYNPALRNAIKNNAPPTQQQELYKLLNKFATQDKNRAMATGSYTDDFNSPEFAAKIKPYTDALQHLKDMLSGKSKLSISEAYFTAEYAYGESYLTPQEFKGIIKQSGDFIRQWMQEHNLSIRDNAAINYAVQQFMGSELNITVPKQKTDGIQSFESFAHKPFSYDFIDNGAEKDHRNFFLTKCLATGMGQCNSLPAVYLSLVEALGGKAYLTTVPQHSFVKYPDKKGNLRNYEPTSHWDITSEWYQDNMFVSALAAKNKVYLNPYNEKQIIADIVLQLSMGYFRKHGGGNGKFIMDCINTTKPYFPNNNNLAIYFTYSSLYACELAQAMRRNGIDRLSNINKSAETQQIFEQWQANEKIIKALGYREEPRDLYQEMMKYHEFRGREQNLDGKTKRTLFIKIK